MHLILNQISNFFAAVLNVYAQIPKELNEQIKTMQAFLRSYDQKQLFLIQNFVRRIEQKAQKAKHHNKRKRHDFKTQPSLLDQENKQNVYNMMNVCRPGSIQIPSYDNPFKLHLKDKSNQLKEKNISRDTQFDAEIKRYRELFDNYSSSGSRDDHNSSQMRPLSMPSDKTLSPIPMVSSRQMPKLNQSPYFEAFQHNFDSVKGSGSCIMEPNFHSIQIREIPKEQRTQGMDKMERMRDNIRELKEEMAGNQEIRVLESCLLQLKQ